MSFLYDEIIFLGVLFLVANEEFTSENAWTVCSFPYLFLQDPFSPGIYTFWISLILKICFGFKTLKDIYPENGFSCTFQTQRVHRSSFPYLHHFPFKISKLERGLAERKTDYPVYVNKKNHAPLFFRYEKNIDRDIKHWNSDGTCNHVDWMLNTCEPKIIALITRTPTKRYKWHNFCYFLVMIYVSSACFSRRDIQKITVLRLCRD